MNTSLSPLPAMCACIAYRLTPIGIPIMLDCMRTTLNIPDQLMRQAMGVTKFTSKTDTIILALQELVRKRDLEALKASFGKIKINVDIAKSRRRPQKKG